MCDAMREKIAAILRSSVQSPTQTHDTNKLQNGSFAPVLVFSDEGIKLLYLLYFFIPVYCDTKYGKQ